MKYGSLYVKTDNSLLNSMIRIPSLIEFAKSNNLKTLSIADNNMFGVMEFYKACIDNNIKPIIGLEVMVNSLPIVIYCKDYLGYKNLIKISTISSSEEVTKSTLEKYSNNVICIIPYKSRQLYKSLLSIYDSLYLGYENNTQYEVYLKHNLKNIVYMNEVLYLNEFDKKYYPYLKAIEMGKNIKDIEEINGVHHFVLDSSYEINCIDEICDSISVTISKRDDLLPKYPCPPNYDSYSYLRHLCKVGLKKRFGDKVQEKYITRLNYELEVIKKMDFCNYFLVVWDYVKYAKENDILVGPGRGSAAGSLVSYCLFITEIDPLKYNLLFERFLNPERITMPDIDIDFEDTKRDLVVSYCTLKYGIKKVVEIITFGTLGSKQVIRDIGRCMNISLDKIDALSKQVDARASLIDNYKKNLKIKLLLEEDTSLQELYKVSIKLEGIKRHTSIHAAGVVMSSVDIDEVIPLYKHGDMYLTGYSMSYLEELGLLKMDFLSITTLGTISRIIKEINNDGINLSFNDIPFSDKQALDIFKCANTTGIFQFESSGMMNFLRKLKPDTFEDIFAALALYRPGPMGNIDTYIRRKNGLEKIDYLDPSLEAILKPTYGILIYQEQIMQVAHILADYSLGEADILRRAMSKKNEDILVKEKERFKARALAKGYSLDLIEKVYGLIFKFAAYGFNRSHSVAYAVISYKMAYLKAHYPKYFMSAMLTLSSVSSANTKKYIYECKANHVKIFPPNINKSGLSYTFYEDGILYPLASIKGVGENISNIIIEERKNGIYKSIYDFIVRVYNQKLNRNVLINLINASCFDDFGFNKKTLISNIDVIINYGEIAHDLDDTLMLEPELVICDEYSNMELMEHELEVFGFYLSNHPVTEYKNKYQSAISIKDVDIYFDKTITTIAYIDRLRENATKKNEMMCFLTCSDELSKIDAIMFPRVYEKYKNVLSEKIVVLLTAKVEKRFDKYQLIIDKLQVLD